MCYTNYLLCWTIFFLMDLRLVFAPRSPETSIRRRDWVKLTWPIWTRETFANPCADVIDSCVPTRVDDNRHDCGRNQFTNTVHANNPLLNLFADMNDHVYNNIINRKCRRTQKAVVADRTVVISFERMSFPRSVRRRPPTTRRYRAPPNTSHTNHV